MGVCFFTPAVDNPVVTAGTSGAEGGRGGAVYGSFGGHHGPHTGSGGSHYSGLFHADAFSDPGMAAGYNRNGASPMDRKSDKQRRLIFRKR